MKKLRATPASLNSGFESIRPAAAAQWVIEGEHLQAALRDAERELTCAVPGGNVAVERWASDVADALSVPPADRTGELDAIAVAVRRACEFRPAFQTELDQLRAAAVRLFSTGDPQAFQRAWAAIAMPGDPEKMEALRAEVDRLKTAIGEHRSNAPGLFPQAETVQTPSGPRALTGDPETNAAICSDSVYLWAKLWRASARAYGRPVTWKGTLIESISDDRRKQFEDAYATLGCKPAAKRESVAYLPFDAKTGRLTAIADPRNFPEYTRPPAGGA